MAEPLTYRFRQCEVRSWPDQQYLETLYPDGHRAGATRDCDVGSADYAAHLGYSDCWRCLVEHEVAHTLISERMGQLWSPTLYAVAHEYSEGTAPYEERLYEEALVLAVQRYMGKGEVLPILLHPTVRPHFSLWSRQIRSTARGLLAYPTESEAA